MFRLSYTGKIMGLALFCTLNAYVKRQRWLEKVNLFQIFFQYYMTKITPNGAADEVGVANDDRLIKALGFNEIETCLKFINLSSIKTLSSKNWSMSLS